MTTVREGEASLGGTFQLSSHGEITAHLPHNASSLKVKEALEALPSVSEVDVSRVENLYGYSWTVTQIGDLGPQPRLQIITRSLTGDSARGDVSFIQRGRLPEGDGYYGVATMGSSSTFSFVLQGLFTGASYTVRVAPVGAQGKGFPRQSEGVIPRTVPDPPYVTDLFPLSDSSAKIVWRPGFDGGAATLSYEIQWSETKLFGNDGNEVSISHVNKQSYFYNIIGLQHSLRYYVRMRAENEMGYSSWTKLIAVQPQLLAPGPVLNPIVRSISGVELLVEWDQPSTDLNVFGGDGGDAIDRYLIEWDSPSFHHVDDPPSDFVYVSQLDSFAYILGCRNITTGNECENINRGVNYTVRITPFNSVGSGTQRTALPAPITARDRTPSAPLGLEVKSTRNGSLSAYWSLPRYDGGASLKEFILEYSSHPSFSPSTTEKLPIFPEHQRVDLESSTKQTTQFVDLLVSVENEIQQLSTNIEGLNEIQKISIDADPVQPNIQEIVTSAADIDEVQSITANARDINEIQVVETTGDEAFEVITVTTTATRRYEIQEIVLEEPDVGRNALIDFVFSSDNPSDYDNAEGDKAALLYCPEGSTSISFTTTATTYSQDIVVDISSAVDRVDVANMFASSLNPTFSTVFFPL